MEIRKTLMTPREIVTAQFNHTETAEIPYQLLFEQPLADKLNDHFGSDDWMKKIKNYFEVTGTFDTICTITMDGPDTGTDAYGSKWTMTDKISHVDIPALSVTPYEKYKFPELDKFIDDRKRELMWKQLENNPDAYRVLNIGAGIYELSWRLMGVDEALTCCAGEPELYDDILANLTHLVHQFIDEAVKLPVDAIFMGEDWCDQRGVTMGVDRWRKFIKPRQAEFFEKIHKAGKKTIMHMCGRVDPLLPELTEIGLDVFESVQPEPQDMNPFELKKKYGDKLSFWGGLGCQSIVTFGTPKELRDQIRKLRSGMSKGGGYILAPAKALNNTVSLENALAIYETFIEEITIE